MKKLLVALLMLAVFIVGGYEFIATNQATVEVA